MIPEFIAFNKVTKKMFMVNDINGLLQNTVVCCKHGSGCECMEGIDGYEDEVDIYPYIHRKDKAGNKVYAGSKVSFLFKGGWRYSGIVEYDARDSSYIIAFNRCSSCRVGQAKDIKVIGHIAEEGIRDTRSIIPSKEERAAMNKSVRDGKNKRKGDPQ